MRSRPDIRNSKQENDIRDLNIFIVGSDGEGIQIVGDANMFFALNSTAVAYYENTASSNCLALGELSPGGEGIGIPFQALAKEQFGSPLFTNSSRMKTLSIGIDA